MALPLRYVPPNLLTCISLIVGLLAITAAIAGSFEQSAWLIMLCVLLDKLDGAVARLLKASSRFGLEMDSLADLVTFGVAPAVLVLSMTVGAAALPGLKQIPGFSTVVYLSAFFYVTAAALRLAKFNVVSDAYGKDFFFGIPTTASGALVVLYFLTVVKYELPQSYLLALPGVLTAFALLMVSRVPLPKFGRRKNSAINIFQWVNISLIYVCGLARIFPEYILGAGLVYLFFGSGWALAKGIRPPQLNED